MLTAFLLDTVERLRDILRFFGARMLKADRRFITRSAMNGTIAAMPAENANESVAAMVVVNDWRIVGGGGGNGGGFARRPPMCSGR